MPGDIISADDFTLPLLKTLYNGLIHGRTPASLVEDQATDTDRAEVTRLLLTPAVNDTNESLAMANDCLKRLKRRRIESRIQELTTLIATASGADKLPLMKEFQQLSLQLNKLKSTSN